MKKKDMIGINKKERNIYKGLEDDEERVQLKIKEYTFKPK